MNENLYSLAFDLLAKREHSEKEMMEKLLKKFPQQKTGCQAVIQDLQTKGYINDLQYSEHFIRYYAQQKNKGKQWYLQKLLQKGIAKETCETALKEYFSKETEYESAKKALFQKIPSVAHLPPYQQKAKILLFLTSRGFSFSVAQDVLQSETFSNFS